MVDDKSPAQTDLELRCPHSVPVTFLNIYLNDCWCKYLNRLPIIQTLSHVLMTVMCQFSAYRLAMFVAPGMLYFLYFFICFSNFQILAIYIPDSIYLSLFIIKNTLVHNLTA